MAILLLPISVSAGLVGAISGIFNKTSAEGLSSKTVQNMALLVATAQPPSSPDYHAPVVEGDVLVSDTGLGSSPESVIHKPGSDQISIYVVKKGDTLSQIAQMFDVTVNTIKWGNNLSSNTLKEGETLVILPISGVKHTVAKGETLASIAKKYKADAEEIKDYNNIEGSLAVGATIIVPDGEVMPAPSTSGSSVRVGGGSSSGLRELVGYFLRPLVGGRKSQGIHGYNGVDLAAPIGTPILAAADGEVIVSRSGGWNGGYGNYIVIKHSNGTQTLYAHNTANKVSAGDTVNQGDVIGTVGSTGKSTGSHLHFEIRGAKNPF